MGTVDTTPMVEGKNGELPATGGKAARSRSSAIAGDIATLGAGTVLAGVFNVLLVFLIPRLVSVEQYGYWRLFFLYAGYVGFLHFGSADGALLRWAGRTREAVHDEVATSWRYLILQQLAVVVPLLVVLRFVSRLPVHIRVVWEAVLILGLIYNSAALLQNSLQAARVFRPVAIAAALPPGVFVALAFFWSLRSAPTANALMAMYGGAWAVALVYLWTRVKPRVEAFKKSDCALGMTLIAAGWPVVLANTGFGLVQSTDRLVVSWTLPIEQFAQYSLAASTMFVPMTAIAVVSRVFFSHVAAVEHENRARIFRQMSSFLLIAWTLMLPYFFALEAFVRRFLPRYTAALPVAAILVLSVIFLAEVQILHMSYFYLYGRQREFLYLSLVALAVSLVVASTMTLWLRSLFSVAVGQACALCFWWLINEWRLESITCRSRRDWARVLGVGVWSVASYAFALWSTANTVWRTAIYYPAVLGALWLFCANDLRYGWRVLQLGGVRSNQILGVPSS
jgi:O-antigen/teichoic acid export membrane protein